MLSHECIELVQRDLPNFPAELISEWLEPYVKSEGWPPSRDHSVLPNNRWKYLLGGRTVGFWASVTWKLMPFDLEIGGLKPCAQRTTYQLLDGYVNGTVNMYTLQISDGKERFDSIVKYIVKNRSVPGNPVLLKTQEGYDVMDGNHRIAAYFGIKLTTVIAPELEVWIGDQ